MKLSEFTKQFTREFLGPERIESWIRNLTLSVYQINQLFMDHNQGIISLKTEEIEGYKNTLENSRCWYYEHIQMCMEWEEVIDYEKMIKYNNQLHSAIVTGVTEVIIAKKQSN